LTSENSLS